jgi:hypothetical protein
MKTSISHVLTFGLEGNAVNCQTRGWSGREPEHNWSIGPESELRLPGIDAPHGAYVEVTCGAYRTQRLAVLTNGTQIGTCELTGHGTFAWRAPPNSGPLNITFQHPDAARPCDVGDSADNRPLAISFRRIRILPIVGHATQNRVHKPASDQDLAMRRPIIAGGIAVGFGLGLNRKGWSAGQDANGPTNKTALSPSQRIMLDGLLLKEPAAYVAFSTVAKQSVTGNAASAAFDAALIKAKQMSSTDLSSKVVEAIGQGIVLDFTAKAGAEELQKSLARVLASTIPKLGILGTIYHQGTEAGSQGGPGPAEIDSGPNRRYSAHPGSSPLYITGIPF